MIKLIQRFKTLWLDAERTRMHELDDKDVKLALKMIVSQPLRGYLVALMDEAVRSGIYLSDDEREGAKYLVKTLQDELKKGDALIKKEDKEKPKK